jgi:hypothetical protein
MNRESPKILVVTGKTLGKGLTDYALKVAKRLDLEIILLFVDEETPYRNHEEQRQARKPFEAEIKGAAAEFSALAWEQAINVATIADVNKRTAAIALAREQEPEIRFVLTDSPSLEGIVGTDDQYPQLTVLRSPERD